MGVNGFPNKLGKPYPSLSDYHSGGDTQTMTPAEYRPRRRDGHKPRRPRFDFISLIGELLIITGLLGCLFAFWDVYVTDWQVASFNKSAINQLKDRLPKCPKRVSTDERKDNPPVPVLSDPGAPMAALHFPRWNYMVIPVREGVGLNILDTGAAGHYPSTVLPGQIGNFSVAAHRRSYGSSFARVEELKKGDPVVVETPQAWYVYKVVSSQIVQPSDGQVIAPVPNHPNDKPTERFMTMTTCHPMFGYWERYIVHLKLDHWVPYSSGIPKELAPGGNACSR